MEGQTDVFVPLASKTEAAGWRGVIDTRAAAFGVVAVIAAVIRVMIGSQSAASLALAVSLGALIVAATLVYIQLRKRNAGLYASAGSVGIVDSIGRKKGLDIHKVDRLELCSVAIPRSDRSMRLLLFVDREGRAALTFHGADGLAQGGLELIERQAGIPLRGSWANRLTPQELQRAYPAALSPLQRFSYSVLEHPNRTAIVAIAVTFAAFVALAIFLLVRAQH